MFSTQGSDFLNSRSID